MVLLRNENNALPLAQGTEDIAAFGNTSYNIITGGTGSGDVNEAYSVSLTEGLENAGYVINADLQQQYDSYLTEMRANQSGGRGFGGMFGRQRTIDEMPLNTALAERMAETTDMALITIGRNSGEGSDRTNEEGDFLLSQAEQDMIKTVCSAFHAMDKKVVVILNIGGVIETASWRGLPDAILLAWQGGQETGNAIADVLSGKVNPSGRLATTFPLKYDDNPSSATFPGEVIESEEAEGGATEQTGGFGFMGGGSDAEVTYDDGVYVGYRYYETFGILTSYEFGYGLSYTSFSYDNFNLSSRTFKDLLTVSVDVTNTGNVAGKEVVQLYLAAPEMIIDKPEQELKGFAKTRLLQPGETQTITFEITPRNLASFRSGTSSWFAESGTYDVRLCSSSLYVRQDASFELDEELTVKEESKTLEPVQSFLEITTR
jgi:beta-glucosidase